MKKILLFPLALLLSGQLAAAPEAKAILTHYADIAHAKYEDSLNTARQLSQAVERLLADPSAVNLNSARSAWKAARVPYQQTKAYRFGNAIVDDWEKAG